MGGRLVSGDHCQSNNETGEAGRGPREGWSPDLAGLAGEDGVPAAERQTEKSFSFTPAPMALTLPNIPSISPANLLTEAHGSPATRACPRLADQALAGVTDVAVVAGLPQPPCTYPAAAAAIQHQGHPQWTSGWWPGTDTRCWAQLSTHLQRWRPHSAMVIPNGQ